MSYTFLSCYSCLGGRVCRAMEAFVIVGISEGYIRALGTVGALVDCTVEMEGEVVGLTVATGDVGLCAKSGGVEGLIEVQAALVVTNSQVRQDLGLKEMVSEQGNHYGSCCFRPIIYLRVALCFFCNKPM